MAGVSLRDRVRSSVIRDGLGVELLLLCVKRSQLRWFGHLVRTPPGRLPMEMLQASPVGKRSASQSGLMWPGKDSLGLPAEAAWMDRFLKSI